MKAKAGNVYCTYNRYLQRYTACQVIRIEEDKAVLLGVDWVGDELMHPDCLATIQPLLIDFMYWESSLCLTNVSLDVPSSHIYIGCRRPLIDEPCYSYGLWNDGYKTYRQLKWQEIPEERRAAFKAASKSEEKILLADKEVPVNKHQIYDTSIAFDDIRELGVLPCLSALYLERWHLGLGEYLRECPFIGELSLQNHQQRVLDFRETHLCRLSVDLSGVEELYLNDSLEQLFILCKPDKQCKIFSHSGGSTLALNFQKEIVLFPELCNLAELHCSEVEELDFVAIWEGYPHLQTLRLWGKPGSVQNFSLLERFRELQVLSMSDLFGFIAAEVPDPEKMEKLTRLWMESLPADAAKAVKKRYKKRAENGLDLWIKKPRKPEWLAQNLDNPFRAWDGQENISATHAKKAAAQYRNTRNEVVRLIEGRAVDISSQLETLVVEYAEVFNKMDKRTPFIETVEREDIYVALSGILDLLPDQEGIDKEALLELFDQKRDF